MKDSDDCIKMHKNWIRHEAVVHSVKIQPDCRDITKILKGAKKIADFILQTPPCDVRKINEKGGE